MKPAVITTVKFIDNAADARDVCRPLLDAAADATPGGFDLRIAVDLEGWDLGPSGKIAVVSVATSQRSVALFDFGRMDVGALFHQFGVTVAHVVDLQVPAVRKFIPNSPYLIGMHKAFDDKLRLFPPADSAIKESGRALFAPEKGGKYEAWFTRPMPPALQGYCAVDVKYFFTAADRLLATPAARVDCSSVSKRRTDLMTSKKIDNFTAHRDF
jgi:hypothetical protein